MISSKDFWKPCKWNADTQNQVWMSQIADSHDNHCSCDQPFSHLLVSIFPPGHKDRDLTIQQIIERDYKETCHSGGDAGRKTGTLADRDGGEGATTEGADLVTDEDLQELIKLGESAAGKER